MTSDTTRGRTTEMARTTKQVSAENYHVAKFRFGTQKHKLLKSFSDSPMLVEEAARVAGLMHAEYWARCSELHDSELIAPVKIGGKIVQAETRRGGNATIFKITTLGRQVLKETEADG